MEEPVITPSRSPVLETPVKEVPKPNNILNVPVEDSTAFFKWWCIFLRPFVRLTDRERDVIASFLKERWELSKTISDPAVLDTMLMTEDVKKRVIAGSHITLQHFYVVMSTLKKKGVITNNKINARLFPNIRATDNGVFQMLILFHGNIK